MAVRCSDGRVARGSHALLAIGSVVLLITLVRQGYYDVLTARRRV